MAARISSREGCSISWIRPTVTCFAPSGEDGAAPPEETGVLPPPQAVMARIIAMVSRTANSFFMVGLLLPVFHREIPGAGAPPVGVAVQKVVPFSPLPHAGEKKKARPYPSPVPGEKQGQTNVCGATLIAVGHHGPLAGCQHIPGSVTGAPRRGILGQKRRSPPPSAVHLSEPSPAGFSAPPALCGVVIGFISASSV